MWLFVSSEYTFFKKTFHDKYPRLPRIVCKRCIMNIPDFQKTFTSFVVTFYNNYFKTVMFTDDDIIDAIKWFNKKANKTVCTPNSGSKYTGNTSIYNR